MGGGTQRELPAGSSATRGWVKLSCGQRACAAQHRACAYSGEPLSPSLTPKCAMVFWPGSMQIVPVQPQYYNENFKKTTIYYTSLVKSKLIVDAAEITFKLGDIY